MASILSVPHWVKLRSHMREAVAKWRWADFDISAMLPRVCSHIRGADAERTRADPPFLEDKDGLGRAVSRWTRKMGCWTHLLRRGFCSRSAFAPRPRMCKRMYWFVLKPIFLPPPPVSAPRMCELNFTHTCYKRDQKHSIVFHLSACTFTVTYLFH